MNYKHLSKYHYIYEVIANDYEIRMERHPIVYSNKDYIYFVRSGDTKAEALITPSVQPEVNYDKMLEWIQYATDPDSCCFGRAYYILDKEESKKLKELIDQFNDEGLIELRKQRMLKKLHDRVAKLNCGIETYERELAKAWKKIRELGGDA